MTRAVKFCNIQLQATSPHKLIITMIKPGSSQPQGLCARQL